MRILPAKWNLSGDDLPVKWETPDCLTLPGNFGGLIELHPVPPAVVGSESLEFETVCRGRVEIEPRFSCCSFARESAGKTGAAVSYVFCEEERLLKVKIYADDPCKLFCNKQKVFDGPGVRGTEAEIRFSKGLNRITLFSKLSPSSMGVMLLSSDWPAELTFLSDMLETADPGWCAGTLSRVRYEECTPAVRIEELWDLTVVHSDLHGINDIWDWLDNAGLRTIDGESELLGEGEFSLFKLSGLSYGNVRFSLSASEGDIVDLIIGTGLKRKRIFPYCANGNNREIVSCICREGENEISSHIPSDCHCVLLYVRKAKQVVKIDNSAFDELSRNFNRECTFSCSDVFWNQLWQAGRDALSRSSVALFPADGCGEHDFYMLDSFWESVNVAAVFGDAGYATSRLRQFAGAQLENGAVVSCSSGKGYDPALFHMFFFPGWILYNYRFTGNMVELRSLMPKLDSAKKFLTSLLEEERFLLYPEAIGEYTGCETDPVVTCRTPVVMNALFCRFMISASEIYDLVERSFDARECRRLVRKVSKALSDNFFDPEAGLFADQAITENDTKIEFSLLGNFFPLLAGIKTEECFEKFVGTFFDFETGSARTNEAESPYFHYLFADMLFSLGQKEWGFRYLRNYWNMRLDSENGVWKEPFSGIVRTSRFSQGETVVPNLFLLREIVGVRMAEPAFSLIYFDPAYETVDQCEAAIPTIYGRIHLTWKKQPDGGLEVNIYSSHPLKVLPEISEELLKKSTFSLSESVTLVKSVNKEA